MKSKLGFYCQHDTSTAWDYIHPAQPRTVKWMDFNNAHLQAVRDWGGTNIGRIATMTTMDVNAAVALIQQYDAQTAGLIDYWELLNEPAADAASLALLNDFSMGVISKVKRPILVGNFGQGNPGNIADWPNFYPAMRLAQQYGGGLALHEYGAPTLQASAPWHIFRYRLSQASFPSDLSNIPIYITECGIDGGVLDPPVEHTGWKTYATEASYLSQLQWYDEGLLEDNGTSRPNVKGAHIFVVSHFDPWGNFEIIDAPSISAYIASTGVSTVVTVGQGFLKCIPLIGPFIENEIYHAAGTPNETSLALAEHGYAVYRKLTNETLAYNNDGAIWADGGNHQDGTMREIRPPFA